MLVFTTIVPKRFIYNKLPEIMMNKIITSVDKHKFDNMDTCLKNLGVKYSTSQVLKYALKNLDVKQINGVYLVDISNVLKLNGYTLKQLVDLINYGNTEVKGTQVYTEAERYVNNNKAHLLNDYTNER